MTVTTSGCDPYTERQKSGGDWQTGVGDQLKSQRLIVEFQCVDHIWSTFSPDKRFMSGCIGLHHQL